MRQSQLRRQADQQVSPANEIPHAHLISTAPFEFREDGSIVLMPDARSQKSDDGSQTSDHRPPTSGLPRLTYSDTTRGIWLYHGNSLELLDAIAAKYPEGRFDAIFADPPYFLSNGGITCHAGKMVKVDKGDWDVSRGPELNHEFNVEWLKRCQCVLKPNGTIWVTGTHHVIFSIGYAMQQLGYKILNDIAWEKPNPPPNLSCRYFTHSTETVLWAAKSEKSKHVFNYKAMKAVTGKQMKTVWRDISEGRASQDPNQNEESNRRHKDSNPRYGFSNNEAEASSIWTMSAPGSDEKTHGKHPTQKPVALVERCLLASTNEGDLILDPFLGGGTTVVACVRLNRGCVGIEMDFTHANLAQRRADREIIDLWLRHFRVRVEISVVASGQWPDSAHSAAPTQIDLAIFPDSINGSRDMADVPEIPTERIFHECKFVFLACCIGQQRHSDSPRRSETETGATASSVVHTAVDISLQDAWSHAPTSKKRETTHIVRCETEIFRVKSG